MTHKNSNIQDSLKLIQWYYSYFLLSLYTDDLMKQGNIALPSWDIVIKTTSANSIKLNTKRITTILDQIKASPQSKNVYWYFSYVSSIKWLFGIFMDMHTRSPEWKSYLKDLLWQRYHAYIHAIRICRNLLTHQHTTDFRLSKYDIASQHESLLQSDKRIISLTFLYKDIFWNTRKWQDSYWFHISINTSTLHSKRTLFDIIDEHTMFMLAESVYNLTDYYLKKK